jgi:hypothetical protein
VAHVEGNVQNGKIARSLACNSQPTWATRWKICVSQLQADAAAPILLQAVCGRSGGTKLTRALHSPSDLFYYIYREFELCRVVFNGARVKANESLGKFNEVFRGSSFITEWFPRHN